MQIKLNAPLGCEDEIVTISNEGENPNYLDVSVVMEGSATNVTVSLDEITSAILAFDGHKSRQDYREKEAENS